MESTRTDSPKTPGKRKIYAHVRHPVASKVRALHSTNLLVADGRPTENLEAESDLTGLTHGSYLYAVFTPRTARNSHLSKVRPQLSVLTTHLPREPLIFGSARISECPP